LSEPLPLLRWSIQALSQPVEVQLALFPDFTCKADELALNFEDGIYELVGRDAHVTVDQRGAIDYLDELVTTMSGEHNAEFWTEAALEKHPAWEEIRARARSVAVAFGWPIQPPEPSGAIYISAG
jgi:hypothetical protein